MNLEFKLNEDGNGSILVTLKGGSCDRLTKYVVDACKAPAGWYPWGGTTVTLPEPVAMLVGINLIAPTYLVALDLLVKRIDYKSVSTIGSVGVPGRTLPCMMVVIHFNLTDAVQGAPDRKYPDKVKHLSAEFTGSEVVMIERLEQLGHLGSVAPSYEPSSVTLSGSFPKVDLTADSIADIAARPYGGVNDYMIVSHNQLRGLAQGYQLLVGEREVQRQQIIALQNQQREIMADLHWVAQIIDGVQNQGPKLHPRVQAIVSMLKNAKYVVPDDNTSAALTALSMLKALTCFAASQNQRLRTRNGRPSLDWFTDFFHDTDGEWEDRGMQVVQTMLDASSADERTDLIMDPTPGADKGHNIKHLVNWLGECIDSRNTKLVKRREKIRQLRKQIRKLKQEMERACEPM